MNTTQVKVNGITITPNISEVLTQWFGNYEAMKLDNPELVCVVETIPESYAQSLIKVQDLLIDQLEQTYPEIDRNLFDVLSAVKSMRLDFEKLIPSKRIENE